MEPLRVNDGTAEDMVVAALIGGLSIDTLLAQVSEDDFSNERNKVIYKLVLDMHTAGQRINLVSMEQRLTARHILTPQAYFAFVDMLKSLHSKKLVSYIERLKKATQRKEILHLVMKAEGQLREQEEPDVILKDLADSLVLHSPSSVERTLIEPKNMAVGCLEAVSNRMDSEKRKASVINLSFGSINRAIGGFEKGDLIILSAESGAGKSAFSMNIARDVGVTQKRPCLYMNSEMTTEQQQLRWASFLSGVSHSAIRAGEITDDGYVLISNSLNQMLYSQLYTLNMPDMQIGNVLSEIRLLHKKFNLEMVIVDYIGRMDTMNIKDNAKEWQLMLNSARKLKTLATELNVVIIMVAQLTKDGGSLAQGSYMKHEADLWVNICRWKNQEALQKNYPWNCFLEVRKARNVDTNTGLRMYFHGDTLAFTDKEEQAIAYAKDDEGQEVPV